MKNYVFSIITPKNRKYIIFLIVFLIFIVAVVSKAAAPSSIVFEAESPQTSQSTVAVTDTTASNGSYLRYGAENEDPKNPPTTERPTRENTGPRYPLTSITPNQFFSSKSCNRQKIVGDLNFDQSWMRGQTFSLTDCEITGRVYVYINSGGTTLPLSDMPIINMDYVDINSGMIAFNASKFTANHTYINKGAQWGLKDVWAPFINDQAPYNFTNSVFYTEYLAQPFHTETLHTGDYGIGYRFKNVSFEQQGGPLTNSGVTATINFHGIDSVFDGCWFIFDGDVPAYYSAYLDARNSSVINSWFEKGAGGYVYPSSTYRPTFTNNRDFLSNEVISPL